MSYISAHYNYTPQRVVSPTYLLKYYKMALLNLMITN
jgi:hypothetical protein